jgi:membrane protease YdiL (CAAX protease family)
MPMLLFAQQPIPAADFWIMAIEGVFLVGSLFAWLHLCKKYLSGKPVLPAYHPRKFTPWKGWDLLIILSFNFMLIVAIQFGIFCTEKALGRLLFASGNEPPATGQKEPARREKEIVKKTTVHPAAQLLQDKNPLLLALVFTVVSVIVPITEEFLYRLLLIGWLESEEVRWRRKLRSLLGVLPWGMMPIVFSALLFASMHNWKESPVMERSVLVLGLCMTGLINLFMMTFAFYWVRWQSGATAKDFGWDSEKFWGDVATGTTAFFAVALPIYALHIDLAHYVLPAKYAPDPIALFFFALVLGLLYYRTHRIVPSIVMHMLLNTCSLAMAWFSH